MPVVTPPSAEIPAPPPSAFPAVTPAPVIFPSSSPSNSGFSGPTGGALELEKLRRAIENLTDPAQRRTATAELMAKGSAAIPVLLDALERRDRGLRHLAFEVLKHVAREAGPLAFDPDAPDDVRLRQVAYLRVKLERRRG